MIAGQEVPKNQTPESITRSNIDPPNTGFPTVVKATITKTECAGPLSQGDTLCTDMAIEYKDEHVKELDFSRAWRVTLERKGPQGEYFKIHPRGFGKDPFKVVFERIDGSSDFTKIVQNAPPEGDRIPIPFNQSDLENMGFWSEIHGWSVDVIFVQGYYKDASEPKVVFVCENINS